jgi:hypothetical protein
MSVFTDISNLASETGFYGIIGGAIFHALDNFFEPTIANRPLTMFEVPRVFFEAVLQIFLDGMTINMMTDFMTARGYSTDNRDILAAITLPGFQPNLLNKLSQITLSIRLWLNGWNPLQLPQQAPADNTITTPAPAQNGDVKCKDCKNDTWGRFQ